MLAETRGNRKIAAMMFHALAHLHARRGEFEEALSLAERCRNIHWENGAMWSFWVLTEIIWDIKVLAGEPGDALEVLTEG